MCLYLSRLVLISLCQIISVVGPSDQAQQNIDIFVAFDMYKCWYLDCEPPIPRDELPPKTEVPDEAVYLDKLWFKSDPDNDNGVTTVNNTDEPTVAIEDGNDLTIPEGNGMASVTELMVI